MNIYITPALKRKLLEEDRIMSNLLKYNRRLNTGEAITLVLTYTVSMVIGLLLLGMLGGCAAFGDLHWSKPGALWIYERNTARCLDVKSSMWGNGITFYRTENGEQVVLQRVPTDFHEGEQCPMPRTYAMPQA